MNERIDELLEKCRTTKPGCYGFPVVEFDEKKLVKLKQLGRGAGTKKSTKKWLKRPHSQPNKKRLRLPGHVASEKKKYTNKKANTSC